MMLAQHFIAIKNAMNCNNAHTESKQVRDPSTKTKVNIENLIRTYQKICQLWSDQMEGFRDQIQECRKTLQL
jgi:hypothetical protein